MNETIASDQAGSRLAAVLLALCGATAMAGETDDRLAILELMDRYGVVHDFGSPEDYADLFTDDGEIAIGGGPTVAKGRAALIAQGQRDHERFGAPPDKDGNVSSIMRHVISNRVVKLTGKASAEGSSYVLTLINDRAAGLQVLGLSRYQDRYAKVRGEWRIQHRTIFTEAGNEDVAKKYGFR
jgi:hypothetical protein